MGCRACVRDPVAQALFGSDALCPACELRYARTPAGRRRRRVHVPALRGLLAVTLVSGICLAGLLYLAALYLQQQKQAGWDECANRARGEIAEPQDYDAVLQACGDRPDFL